MAQQLLPYRTILNRSDQVATASLAACGLVAIVVWCLVNSTGQGRMAEIDQQPPLAASFQIELGAAAWWELVQLPGVGETLARRIIESREKEGPFKEVEDLLRVRGVGRKNLEQIRPYLKLRPGRVP